LCVVFKSIFLFFSVFLPRRYSKTQSLTTNVCKVKRLLMIICCLTSAATEWKQLRDLIPLIILSG